jgi:hypothetical protein
MSGSWSREGFSTAPSIPLLKTFLIMQCYILWSSGHLWCYHDQTGEHNTTFLLWINASWLLTLWDLQIWSAGVCSTSPMFSVLIFHDNFWEHLLFYSTSHQSLMSWGIETVLCRHCYLFPDVSTKWLNLLVQAVRGHNWQQLCIIWCTKLSPVCKDIGY